MENKAAICFQTTYRIDEVLDDHYGKSTMTTQAFEELCLEYIENLKLEEIDLSNYKRRRGEFQKRIKISSDIKDKFVEYFGKNSSRAFSIIFFELMSRTL